MKYYLITPFIYVSLIHCIAFMLEFIYQKYCYPTNLIGFVYIIFTHDNNICLHIRKISLLLHSLISNLVVSTISFSFITIHGYFKDKLDQVEI